MNKQQIISELSLKLTEFFADFLGRLAEADIPSSPESASAMPAERKTRLSARETAALMKGKYFSVNAEKLKKLSMQGHVRYEVGSRGMYFDPEFVEQDLIAYHAKKTRKPNISRSIR